VREVGRIGKYELVTRLATGGMAEIFLARLRGEAGFEKLVVLKLILPELAEDPEFVRMFLDEARLSARISHPNVCPVFDLGQADGRYFVAMEYLEGVPLMSIMRELSRAKRFEPRLIAGLMVQACEGLHHAHELRDVEGKPIGVVHRDVSPSNLFVTVDGVVKVLDFGVAKALAAAQQTGSLKGHYAYMAPEQIQAGPLDRRADVFALGVLLFELATGQRLFRRESDLATFRAITEEPIPKVRATKADAPPALADAIDRALEREPDRRFATARALGEALIAAVSPLGGVLSGAALATEVSGLAADDLGKRRATIANALALTGHDPEPTAAPTSPASPFSRRRERARALPWTAIGVAGLALAGLGLYAARPSPPSPRQPASPPVAELPAPALPSVAAAAAPPQTAPAPPEPAAPSPARTPAPRAARATASTPGFLTMDSQPFATVFVDGRSLGPTPLYRVPLPPGTHTVVAQSSKGAKRTFTVHIEPGREAPPRRLVW
jgi:serine/threonine-protein kinase